MCLNCPDKSRVKRKLLCLFMLFKKLKENLQSCGNAFFRLHTTIQENQNKGIKTIKNALVWAFIIQN